MGTMVRVVTDCAGAKKLDKRAEDGENHADLANVSDKDQHGDEHGANDVTGNHDALYVPVVNKHAGNGTDDGQRQHIRDGYGRDLHGGAMQLEGDQADDAEEGEEVAKDADELGQPERAKRLVLKNRLLRVSGCGG